MPTFKKGNQEEMSNHRLIVLLFSFAKVIEKAIKSRFLKFLYKTKLFYSQQYGFTKVKSIENSILDFMPETNSAINQNYKIQGLFIDFSTLWIINFQHKNQNQPELVASARDWFSSFPSGRVLSANWLSVQSCLRNHRQCPARFSIICNPILNIF